MNTPPHQLRYAEAWKQFKELIDSGSRDTTVLRQLEDEMNEARDCFGVKEYHEFTERLAGWKEYWGGFERELDELLDKIFGGEE